MQSIEKYFGSRLTSRMREQLVMLGELYRDWNGRINVVSRRDMEGLYERHVLHSLVIARACEFAAGARILDVGCGGGFPGIPLAIVFPEARFTLCDSVGKKITVVRAVADSLGLRNVEAVHGRAEESRGRFDYVVSRAVARMSTLIGWTESLLEPGRAGSLPNGTLCLKGGDLAQELAEAGREFTIYNISGWFDEEWFDTKKVVYCEKTRVTEGDRK